MKICLIEPSKFVSLTNFVSTISMPPIGLAYIAAAARKANHRVSVVDGPGSAPRSYFSFQGVTVRGLANAEIIKRIPKDVEAIGFGCMFSSNWVYVRELIKDVRKAFPKVFMVLGGEHGTGFPEFSMKQAPLDAVVMGEGEETIIQLLDSVEKGLPLEQVPGIAFRDKAGAVRVNARRARIKNIDSIAWPAWDLFDIETYNRVNQPHGASQGKFMPMLATRGCPFSCTFCTSPNMWTTQWIPRDPKNVVDEMQSYQKKYGTSDFQFEDLTAIVQRKWIGDFCDEIISREMRITFQMPSGTRSESIDYEIAQKLKAAGCHEFAFAPESGDPGVLKAIRKKVRLPSMFESARAAMKANINVGCFFIIGFPEDDYGSVLKTYAAIAKCAWLGFTNVNLNAYSPQPNTESFRALVKNGVIADLNDGYLLSLFTFQDYGAKKTSYNPRFGHLELSFLVILGTAIFYGIFFLRKPYRIVQLFVDLASDSARNKSNKMVKSMLKDAATLLKNKILKPFKATGSG
ncbi:MAG: B12-binding domain-containing radical SAM protein [Nitrospinae bacterium]|nr:B12-binding domain-containing radical SAM protein [Nitrospinota bacterium]